MKLTRYLVGPMIVALFAGAVYFLFLDQPVVYDLRGRPLHQVTLYKIHLRDGEVRQACCPRCGLHFQQGRDDVVSLEMADFRTNELLDATQAFYVEDSSVNMCFLDTPVHRHIEGTESTLMWDRCMPGLLALESREAAEDFRSKHGGLIKTYNMLVK